MLTQQRCGRAHLGIRSYKNAAREILFANADLAQEFHQACLAVVLRHDFHTRFAG